MASPRSAARPDSFAWGGHGTVTLVKLLSGTRAGMYISANYSREGTGIAEPGDDGLSGDDGSEDGPSEEVPPDGDPEVDQEVKNEAVPTSPDDPPPVEPAPEAPEG